jgi:hypothetical protein
MTERESPFTSLRQILDADGSPGWKAEMCLARVTELPPDDLEIRQLLAAAQTYATLEVAAQVLEQALV